MKIQQSIDAIENSSCNNALYRNLESSANDIGCEISDTLSFEGNRDWFSQSDENGDARMVAILDAAIKRRNELRT